MEEIVSDFDLIAIIALAAIVTVAVLGWIATDGEDDDALR